MTNANARIALPKNIIVTPSDEKNAARVTIEPCYPGYGTTLGNALRRILLSSIPGAAITSVSIKGATHEFTTINHIKEDMVEFILRVKQIRLKLFDTEKTTVMIKAKGEKIVKAGDIEATSEVEVVNPELPLVTLSDKEATFEATFVVEAGLGYVPVENRTKTEGDDVNAIMVDAVYTPVRNVNFKVEHVRVGQITNYDKLNLDIATDGSITPTEALRQANDILLQHYSFLGEQLTTMTVAEAETPKKVKKAKKVDE